jgi:hypothetical protein
LLVRHRVSVVFTLGSNRQPEPPAGVCRCPRCGEQITEALGPVNSALDWFRCVLCRHIWARPPLRTD